MSRKVEFPSSSLLVPRRSEGTTSASPVSLRLRVRPTRVRGGRVFSWPASPSSTETLKERRASYRGARRRSPTTPRKRPSKYRIGFGINVSSTHPLQPQLTHTGGRAKSRREKLY